jgi:hypothetical protein
VHLPKGKDRHAFIARMEFFRPNDFRIVRFFQFGRQKTLSRRRETPVTLLSVL